MQDLDEQYIDECVQINPTDIQAEFCRVSSDLHHWRGRWVDALDKELKSEAARKTAYAEEYQRLRILKESGAKSLTESAIDAAILTNESYKTCIDSERVSRIEKERIYSVVEAIQAKKEVLISLGAQLRQEVEIGIRERDRSEGQGWRR